MRWLRLLRHKRRGFRDAKRLYRETLRQILDSELDEEGKKYAAQAARVRYRGDVHKVIKQ